MIADIAKLKSSEIDIAESEIVKGPKKICWDDGALLYFADNHISYQLSNIHTW